MPNLVNAPRIQPQTEGALRKLGVTTENGITHGEVAKLDQDGDKQLSDKELAVAAPEDRAALRQAMSSGKADTAIAFLKSERPSTGKVAGKHAVGLVVENGAHVLVHGGALGARGVPALGAAVNGYFAAKNISSAVDAGQRGNIGSAVLYSLAGTIDGTSAVVNAAGAATGVGCVISVPVNLGLGIVSSGMSVAAAWLDD